MKLTITTLTDIVFTLEVNDEMELENFKALCSLEANIAAEQMAVFFNGNILTDTKKTLAAYGIHDGDMLLVQKLPGPAGGGGGAQQSAAGAHQGMGVPNVPPNLAELANSMRGQAFRDEVTPIFEALRTNPERLASLRVNNPRLADAYDKGLEEFISLLSEQNEARIQAEQRRIRMMMADPFDSEAQHMIAEEIRQQQIESNMENAMEYLPESFGEVTMLYINCKVNGNPIKAFVDSGAQSTIMSKACAERCNILRLIDKRFQGIARGVGTQKILGRIHLVQLEINGIFIPTSFMILEEQPMEMLLGLDMLRRYQCTIDLHKNVLRIGTTGTETTFLHENEIPKYKEAAVTSEDADIQRAIQSSLQSSVSGASTSANYGSSSGSQGVVSSTSTSTSSSSTSSSSRPAHPEAVIAELMGLGFTRQEVIAELDAFNGDKNQAMAALFAKSFKIPTV